jgi:glycosyltransferase involved in cell wall biosynthesis
MKKSPKISVIIPTYNRVHLIGKAIKSVLNQTYQDFEIIVVDDGSTDNTEEVVKSFTDIKIHYICHKHNRGASAARNTGIKVSRGEYIAFLDSDDEWLPEKLDKQMKRFNNESSEVGVVYTGDYYIDEKDKKVKKVHIPRKEGYIYEELLAGNYIGTPSALLVKKECFTKAGLFDEDLPACEDYDMWFRIAKYYKFRYVNDLLVICLIHNNQMTGNSELMIEGIKRIQTKYSKEFRKRPYSYSIRYFYLGNKFCHLEKRREGQKYFIKAILIYPFCLKYYIYLLCSIFGTRIYMHISRVRRYFMSMRKEDYF